MSGVLKSLWRNLMAIWYSEPDRVAPKGPSERKPTEEEILEEDIRRARREFCHNCRDGVELRQPTYFMGDEEEHHRIEMIFLDDFGVPVRHAVDVHCGAEMFVDALKRGSISHEHMDLIISRNRVRS